MQSARLDHCVTTARAHYASTRATPCQHDNIRRDYLLRLLSLSAGRPGKLANQVGKVVHNVREYSREELHFSISSMYAEGKIVLVNSASFDLHIPNLWRPQLS